jgi:hypothetical protein
LGGPKPRNLHLLPDVIALAPADAHQILACAMAALEDAIAVEEEVAVVVANLLLPQEAELPNLSLPQEEAASQLLPQAVEGAGELPGLPQPRPRRIAKSMIASRMQIVGQAMAVG